MIMVLSFEGLTATMLRGMPSIQEDWGLFGGQTDLRDGDDITRKALDGATRERLYDLDLNQDSDRDKPETIRGHREQGLRFTTNLFF